MATSRISTYVGDQDPAVTLSVGAATVQGNVELTIDFGTVVTDGGAIRKPTREEALQAMYRIERFILANPWPLV